jgi:hypothetical protein
VLSERTSDPRILAPVELIDLVELIQNSEIRVATSRRRVGACPKYCSTQLPSSYRFAPRLRSATSHLLEQ